MLFKKKVHCVCGLIVLLVLPLSVPFAVGQVFDSGPSDPALFDNVINLPPEPNIGNNQSIGGDGRTTQLNLEDGGAVGFGLEVNSGAEVNLSGGEVFSMNVRAGGELNLSDDGRVGLLGAYTGSLVNISGGSVTGEVRADPGSLVFISGKSVIDGVLARTDGSVNISGGTIESILTGIGGEVTISGGRVDRFSSGLGSKLDISGGRFGRGVVSKSDSLTLKGGEFRLNGIEYTGTELSLVDGDVFSGTLGDGSPFIFSPFAGDNLSDVTLTRVTLPVATEVPLFVDTSKTTGLYGLRSGQILTVQPNGVLQDDFLVVNATLNIHGGSVGDELESDSSEINFASGVIGEDFHAYRDSVVNIYGGTVGAYFQSQYSA